MQMSFVVSPDALATSHFSDPAYHLHTEVMLRGIIANGIILIDAEEALQDQLCNQVDMLASLGKAMTTYALFEELIKIKKQKIIRFVPTSCSCDSKWPTARIASEVAAKCEADSLVVGPGDSTKWPSDSLVKVPILQLGNYISSPIESERRRCYESLPAIDQMESGEFDRLITRATRFSRWLRFYDKQIGKGNNLSGFRRGLERIIRLWVESAHHPKNQLSVEVYTIADESSYAKCNPSVVYNRANSEIFKLLRDQFGIQIKLEFKKDNELKPIGHDRYLQTQSLALSFGQGFDFIAPDDTLRRTTIKLEGGVSGHLQQYRELPRYALPS